MEGCLLILLLQQVFPSILNILKQAPTVMLPPVLCLEMSQLLVFSLKVLFVYPYWLFLLFHILQKASRVWQGLLDEFNIQHGYAILASNMIYVSKHGTAEQKVC